jgi:putative oxidoreductase
MELAIIPTSWAPKLQGAFRIVTGLLFLEHGTGKILHFPQLPGIAEAMPAPMLYATGLIELIGGVLIVVGLFTRPVAFVLSGFMAVAYFLAHAPAGFFPVLNHGELAAMYCFAFLYLAAAGPGAWALDNR